MGTSLESIGDQIERREERQEGGRYSQGADASAPIEAAVAKTTICRAVGTTAN